MRTVYVVQFCPHGAESLGYDCIVAVFTSKAKAEKYAKRGGSEYSVLPFTLNQSPPIPKPKPEKSRGPRTDFDRLLQKQIEASAGTHAERIEKHRKFLELMQRLSSKGKLKYLKDVGRVVKDEAGNYQWNWQPKAGA